MTAQFKAMKFWIGDDPELSNKLHMILNGIGYKYTVETHYQLQAVMLVTETDGKLWYRDAWDVIFKDLNNEEINIDWLRTPVVEDTITIGDRTDIKSELEVALKHINLIED